MSLSEKQVADYGEYVPISVKTKENQQPNKHHKTALHVCMYVCIPNYYQWLITSREKRRLMERNQGDAFLLTYF